MRFAAKVRPKGATILVLLVILFITNHDVVFASADQENAAASSAEMDQNLVKDTRVMDAISPQDTPTEPLLKDTDVIVTRNLASTDDFMCDDSQPHTNVAFGKRAFQSSDNYEDRGKASAAVDGNRDGVFENLSVTHTQASTDPYWTVDLGVHHRISTIKVYNRVEAADRLSGFVVTVYQGSRTVWTWTHPSGTPPHETIVTIPGNKVADAVRVHIPGTRKILSLAEVEVYGVPCNVSMFQSFLLNIHLCAKL